MEQRKLVQWRAHSDILPAAIRHVREEMTVAGAGREVESFRTVAHIRHRRHQVIITEPVVTHNLSKLTHKSHNEGLLANLHKLIIDRPRERIFRKVPPDQTTDQNVSEKCQRVTEKQ